MENNTTPQVQTPPQQNTKFCKHCGQSIFAAAVVCPHCGCQVEEMYQPSQPNIVINNANNNTNTNVNPAMFGIRPKNKWVALLLCIFLGFLGAHKFYEEKTGLGVLYLLTVGLFGIGLFVDFITLLFKPNPYYVR